MAGASRELLCLAAVAGASILAFAAVIATDQVFPNVDTPTHYRWLMQYHAALAEGTWYPRWMPLADLGLGELFYSAYPLYYFLASLLMFLGLSPWDSMKAMAVGSAFLSGAFAFGILRSRLGRSASLFAAILVAINPLPLFLFTHHQSLPWQAGLPFAVSLVLLSVVPPFRGRSALLAVSCCCLVLVHILVAYMALLSIGTALLVEAILRQGRLQAFLRQWLAPALLGLGLAAFNALPAIASRSLHRVLGPEDPGFSSQDWHNSFAFPSWTALEYGVRWFAFQWVFPTLALAGALAAGFILYTTRKGRTREWSVAARLVAVTAAALFFGSELAYPMYSLLDVTRSVQWPYRFVSVASIGAVLATALAGFVYTRQAPRIRAQGIILAAALLPLVLTTIGLNVQLLMTGKVPELSPALLQEEFSQFYGQELLTRPANWRDYVLNGGFEGECRRKSAACQPVFSTTQHRAWRIEASEGQTYDLPMYYFPGWTTRVDGAEVAHDIDPLTGLVRVSIPPGRHLLEIELTGFRPYGRIGSAISALSLAALISTMILGAYRRP